MIIHLIRKCVHCSYQKSSVMLESEWKEEQEYREHEWVDNQLIIYEECLRCLGKIYEGETQREKS